MFTDKNRPKNPQQLSTVSTVSLFFSAEGVKNSDTVDTVRISDTVRAFHQSLQPRPDGYLITMITATGTWYFNGRHSPQSILGWTQNINAAYLHPSLRTAEPACAKHAADLNKLFGAIAEPTTLAVCVSDGQRIPFGDPA